MPSIANRSNNRLCLQPAAIALGKSCAAGYQQAKGLPFLNISA